MVSFIVELQSNQVQVTTLSHTPEYGHEISHVLNKIFNVFSLGKKSLFYFLCLYF